VTGQICNPCDRFIHDSPLNTFTVSGTTEKNVSGSERNNLLSNKLPLTPALSLNGE